MHRAYIAIHNYIYVYMRTLIHIHTYTHIHTHTHTEYGYQLTHMGILTSFSVKDLSRQLAHPISTELALEAVPQQMTHVAVDHR